jgi:hypothetical protein
LKAGSTLCVFCSDIEMRWGAPRRWISSRPEFREIAVAKPLAVVENRDDFRGDAKQHNIFQLQPARSVQFEEISRTLAG